MLVEEIALVDDLALVEVTLAEELGLPDELALELVFVAGPEVAEVAEVVVVCGWNEVV